jgi:cysteine synthase A
MADRQTGAPDPSAPIFECIGDTPLIEIEHASEQCSATIYGKLEYFNPTSSLKDRIYHEMITGAIERGDLEPGMEILECSTGNAGIACTFVGTRLGYDVTIVMPEGMSEERKKVIRAFGGELVETPGGESDVDLSMDRVEEMLEESPGTYWFPNQFTNPDNPSAHEATTGPEVVDQLGDAPDAFLAGQGTGGTLTGAGRHFRESGGSTELFALEPAEAPILSARQWGTHEIEGIGDGFIPENLDPELMDGVVAVESEAALDRARTLIEREGVFSGISSGANIEGAIRLSEARPDLDTIVTIVCDTGHRYFTTRLFEPDHEIEVPDRDHPLDEYSREILDEYQDSWEIIA